MLQQPLSKTPIEPAPVPKDNSETNEPLPRANENASPPIISTNTPSPDPMPHDEDEMEECDNNKNLEIITLQKQPKRYSTRSNQPHLMQSVANDPYDHSTSQETSARSEDMIPQNLYEDEMNFYNAMMEEFSLPTNEPHPAKILQHDQSINNIMECNAVFDPASQNYLEYRSLIKTSAGPLWKRQFGKELGRLAQGYKLTSTDGTNTLHFIQKTAMPRHKKPTYVRICCNYRPQKEDPRRVRITAGGNRIHCAGEKSAPTTDSTTVKTHWNSTISTPNAKCLTIDIKNFYLMSKF